MNPVLVEVHRGDLVESEHRGSVLAVDANGGTVFSIGEVERDIYPRSSLKPFQAIPLVESGAARAFELGDDEIALACASHNGEPVHVKGVTRWLEKLGLSEADLENGPSAPLSKKAARELFAAGGAPDRTHHNCSGKHTGMLTCCLHHGQPTAGYSEFDHPSQVAWMDTLSELVELDIRALPWERDGCGLPAVCMPMHKLALGCARYAQFVGPGGPDGVRAEAMKRIARAMLARPMMVAGSKRCCSDVIACSGVIVKTGAEGVYCGFVIGRGIGFALKMDDGATRGAEVALGALLEKIGVLDAEQGNALHGYFHPHVRNSQDRVTGRVAPSAAWDG